MNWVRASRAASVGAQIVLQHSQVPPAFGPVGLELDGLAVGGDGVGDFVVLTGGGGFGGQIVEGGGGLGGGERGEQDQNEKCE